MTKPPARGKPAGSKADDRSARQAEALRANLRRRKAFTSNAASRSERDQRQEPEKPDG